MNTTICAEVIKLRAAQELAIATFGPSAIVERIKIEGIPVYCLYVGDDMVKSVGRLESLIEA